MPRLALALVLALALAACTSDPADAPAAPPAEGSTPGPTATPAGADAEPLAEADRQPVAPLDEILAPRRDDGPFLRGLPEPRAVRAEPTENRHVEGQTDTVRTYVYRGLEVEAYEVSGGRTFVQRVEATSPAYETESGLAVGRTRGAVESVLGVPVEEDGPVAVYETDEGPTPTTVEVRYETDAAGAERAVRITWRPYVD
jgi:hypothetical protein